MFGYVRVESPELKVKEYECYRATYCGLCRSMGKCTGQCSRMTLSYDVTFLAVCRMALLGESPRYEQKRCFAHPLRKRNIVKRSDVLDYCAGAAALLTYHRVRDDLADEKGAKRLRAQLMRPFASRWRKKADRCGLSELDEKIGRGLARLSELEAASPESVDEPASIFGDILADVMAYGLPEDEARIAESIGRSVGRWIYVADALDDAEEDFARGRYNPFIRLYGRVPTEEERAGIEVALKNHLFAAEAAADLIEFPCEDQKSIVYNIIYLGMPRRIEQINREKSKGCQKKRKGRKKQ